MEPRFDLRWDPMNPPEHIQRMMDNIPGDAAAKVDYSDPESDNPEALGQEDESSTSETASHCLAEHAPGQQKPLFGMMKAKGQSTNERLEQEHSMPPSPSTELA
ncbi:hypothetical protein LTR86_008213 [Recurvomyces mirabilis]|nr:hypothetical protein LTR86_008213 [Recurvomyces mirabilis]